MNGVVGAISAQAHLGEADVKAARAAGRSHNEVRKAMGVPLRAADKADE